MTDDEFICRFEARDLPAFGHRDHLRVALAYARRGGPEAAVAGARRIRAYAEAHGDHAKYHETMTVAWAHLVAHHARECATVDALLAAHPELLDREVLACHYSPELLASDRARAAFVEPDRAGLPT